MELAARAAFYPAATDDDLRIWIFVVSIAVMIVHRVATSTGRIEDFHVGTSPGQSSTRWEKLEWIGHVDMGMLAGGSAA